MITVKISAHKKDQVYKAALEQQLLALQAEDKIKLIGELTENPFEAYEDAKLAIELLVVLLSPDYLSDPELGNKDITPVMEAKSQNSKLFWVQPVILRSCDYSMHAYAEYPAFPIPSGATVPSPIIDGLWPSELDALRSVVSSIKLGVAYIESNKKKAIAPIPEGNPDTKKILVLTSNPKDTKALDLNIEINTIKAVLKRAKNRALFDIELCLDVNKDDLLETLLQEKPHVVHFSGHGLGTNGLLFYGKDGMSEMATGASLANLFRLFSKYIQCVILNACYSQEQAEIISQQIEYVIGTDNAISDSRAIEFSQGFYIALFNGVPIENAFEMAVTHIDFQDLPPNAQVVLYKNGQAVKHHQNPTGNIDPNENHRGLHQNTNLSWTDPRDNISYKLIQVGKTTWMAQNLQYVLEGSLATNNPLEYGRFYTWEQAVAACPEGWHLPSNEEWMALFDAFGGKQEAALVLKSESGWHQNLNGNNQSLFNVFPSGEYQTGLKEFWNIGYYAHFWSKTDLSSSMYRGDKHAHHIRISYRERQVMISKNYKDKFFCVRYVKD